MSSRNLYAQKLPQAASVLLGFFLLLPILAILYPLHAISLKQVHYVLAQYADPFLLTISLAFVTGILVLINSLFAFFAISLVQSKRLRIVLIVLLTLPLIFPPYIGAITYIDIFKSPFGLQIFGRSSLTEFLQASFVLSLFLYPYTFLLLYNRMKMIDPAQLKIVSLYSLSFIEKVNRLYFPHVKDALLSGFLIASLYVVGDFGAVSILRMNTLTTEVYQEIVRKFGYEESALVSLLFVTLAVVSLYIGRRTVGQSVQGLHTKEQTLFTNKTGTWMQCSSYLILAVILVLSLFVPLLKIILWFVQFLTENSLLKSIWIGSNKYIDAALTSFMLSIAAVLIAQVFILAILLTVKKNSVLRNKIYYLSSVLYALPGIVVAFGMLILKFSISQSIGLSILFLLLGYMVRYIGIGFISVTPALDIIPPPLTRIGQTFLRRQIDHVRLIVIPYIRSYVLQSSNYMYFQILRELTIPLLLMPLGMNLLPVRIWQTASEGLYIYSSPAIILLLGLSLPSVIWYIRTHL